MAYITLNKTKLKYNFEYLNNLFKKNNIDWSIVTKLLCGNKDMLSELFSLGINQVCDSRITNLRIIKSLDKNIETMYIKPPARRSIRSVVKYADISMNTESHTVKLLSEEAQRQRKNHKVIIMVELGELREGVPDEKLISMFKKIYQLKNIEIVGIGTNLSCLYGVLPSKDKLNKLIEYRDMLESKFNHNIECVTGGSSVTIHLLLNNNLPKEVNHFRIGETLFFGTDVYSGHKMHFLENDIFKLYSQIIEISEKPLEPQGEFGTNVAGDTYQVKDELKGQTGMRAIIDIGLLDVDPDHIKPVVENIEVVGASSDMIVVNLDDVNKNYKVGDFIEFNLDYISALKLLNSRYVEKKIVAN